MKEGNVIMLSKKKVASLILASLMVAGAFAGCGGNKDNDNSQGGSNPGSQGGSNPGSQGGSTTHYGPENTDLSDEATNGVIKLKVWGSQADQDILKKLCTDFAKEYEEGKSYKFEFEYGVVGEPDAQKTITGDPDAAADVFAFANDQFDLLLDGGYLAKVIRNKDEIIAANDEGSVASVTDNGDLYAYPLTSDNGYFLYYDKSKLTEDDVKSWESIVSKCDTNGWKYHMNLIDNGWYLAGFFIGAGAQIIPSTDNKTNDVEFGKYPDVAEYLRTFVQGANYLNGDDNLVEAGFKDGTLACAVSGTWAAEAFEGALGDNLGATKLPTFTTTKATYQTGSFGGYKLIGVNAYSKVGGAAACLAEYLSSESSQAYRFEQKGYGPSNKNVQASDAVKANAPLAALGAQSAYSVPQRGVANAFWSASNAFSQAIKDPANTKTTQELLDAYVAGCKEA